MISTEGLVYEWTGERHRSQPRRDAYATIIDMYQSLYYHFLVLVHYLSKLQSELVGASGVRKGTSIFTGHCFGQCASAYFDHPTPSEFNPHVRLCSHTARTPDTDDPSAPARLYQIRGWGGVWGTGHGISTTAWYLLINELVLYEVRAISFSVLRRIK